MRFEVLGPMRVVDGETALGVAGSRQRTVLGTLLAYPNEPVPAERIARILWDGEPPADAAASVRSSVLKLRRDLGPGIAPRIQMRGPGYLVEVDEHELDALSFEALYRDTGNAVRARSWADASANASRALDLWRGTPFADTRSQALRDLWLPRLDQRHLQITEWYVVAELCLGHHERLMPRLDDLVPERPLRKNVHAQLMNALARAGRRAGNAAPRHIPPLHAPPRRTGPIPRQLPPAPSSFTGRLVELDTLLSLPGRAEDSVGVGGTVLITAADGMAGVGKTALAIHAAHRLAERYPDGQLFLDLHGHTQGHEPRSSAEVLDWFLRALGVPAQQVPAEAEQRAALYRERLADSHVLIVLDNAFDEAQVRPLIPGGVGCLVLVTSRRRLKGLEDARTLTLDVLPPADAVALLRAVAGTERISPDDPVAREIAELCGRLPLALRIAAALLRHRPSWTLEYPADRLRDGRQRITALSDSARDVQAAFDLSYQGLDTMHQRLFRSLGAVPGPDFDEYAAGALVDAAPSDVPRLLRDLAEHDLITEHSPGRYRLHDLIRAHAQAIADTDRAAALGRLLDYYQQSANRAEALVARYPKPKPVPVPAVGPVPVHAPDLPDPASAWAWLRVERPNLLAALHQATALTQNDRITALTSGLATLLRIDGPWMLAIDLHSDAADAARRNGDRLSEARALTDLGDVRTVAGDHSGAEHALQRAINLYRDLGERHGQAIALTWLGNVRGLSGDYPGAAYELQAALELWRELGERHGQARAQSTLGNVRRMTGDLPEARRDLEEALRLCRDLGDRRGQATTLTWLAEVRKTTGDLPGARRDLEEALRLCRGLGDRRGQAGALNWLGKVRGLAGDFPGAERDLKEALRLCRDLGDQRGQAGALAELGLVRRMTGDLPEAARNLREALDLYRQVGARGNEAWALNRYAAVHAAAGRHATARDLYRDALRLARETQQPDDEAHALEGIGESHLHAEADEPGDSAEADDDDAETDTDAGLRHLTQALAIFRRLAMTPDAERVQSRLSRFTRR
jgi:tetratricopeptide (TPR) repeat protein/DNA-binding SARP family transcriptional activator